MSTVVVHSLVSGGPAADKATLPGHARLVIRFSSSGDYGYWYARLDDAPWQIPLSEVADLDVIPPGWRVEGPEGPMLLVREIVFATTADTPPLNAAARDVNLGVAAVIDPTLIQDDELDPAKVMFLGGFVADVVDSLPLSS